METRGRSRRITIKQKIWVFKNKKYISPEDLSLRKYKDIWGACETFIGFFIGTYWQIYIIMV